MQQEMHTRMVEVRLRADAITHCHAGEVSGLDERNV